MNTLAVIPYTQVGSITADPTGPAPAVEHFGLLRNVSEEAVNVTGKVAGPDADDHINNVEIRYLGGPFSRLPAFANAVSARDATYAFFGLIMVPPGHEIANSGKELIEAVTPWLHDSAHPSFLGPTHATESRTRRAYQRDTHLKSHIATEKYSPHNVFRTNRKPSTQCTVATLNVTTLRMRGDMSLFADPDKTARFQPHASEACVHHHNSPANWS